MRCSTTSTLEGRSVKHGSPYNYFGPNYFSPLCFANQQSNDRTTRLGGTSQVLDKYTGPGDNCYKNFILLHSLLHNLEDEIVS